MPKLYWKYKDEEEQGPYNIIRDTVLAIMKHYIKQYPNKNFGELLSESEKIGKGETNSLFAISEKVKEKDRRRFIDSPVMLNSGEEILINGEWGITGEALERWEKFKSFIAEYGYVIINMEFLDKVQFEHVIEAFDYIDEKGKEGSYGIWYLLRPSLFMGVSHKDYNNWFAIKDAMRVAYLYATSEQPSEENGNFTDEQIKILDGETHWTSQRAEKRFEELRIEVKRFNKEGESMSKDENKVLEMLKVLKQFKQIILFGPPGTGKTFGAKEVLKKLFHVDTDEELEEMQTERASGKKLVEGKEEEEQQALDVLDRQCWDIVQFHPSYNYEDFVRGIRVSTSKKNVTYNTENRIFGKMCQKAGEEYNKAKKDEREPKDYALIIDEINRANVSAVLGELIYALEYRGKKIQEPYLGALTIPKNLYIIGTMNTADRTIGQIDYAVRRRFAFVKCLPEKSVIKDNIALGFFDRVEEIFNNNNYISPDFDKNDVRIGHSYFMVEGKEPTLKILYQIRYQVILILQEYVKDGVLTESATGVINKIAKDVEEEIDKIEADAKKLLADESEDSDSSAKDEDKQQQGYEGNFIFFWKTAEKTGFNSMGVTALNIIKHYATHYNPENLNALLEGLSLPSSAVISESEVTNANTYFLQRGNKISLADGSQNVVSFVWTNNPTNSKWKNFVDKAKSIGCEISICRFVNIGQDPRRNWRDCAKYGFVAAGGDEGGRHAKAMEKLKIGSPVFAYLGGSGVSKGERGFVAWGWVINEAVPIREFKVEGGKLLSECESVYSENKGRNYKEQYTESFDSELCDYAVGIKWVKVLSEEDTVKLTWNANIVRERINGFHKLQKAFNFGGNESEMTSQSLSGKDKKLFCWKHKNGEYSSPEGVGHTARQVITDFINKNSDKNIEYFQKEFERMKLGPRRIVLLEEGKKKVYVDGTKGYFIDHPVNLDNGEVVVIRDDWGITGPDYPKLWKKFKDGMVEFGYSIIIDEESDE